MMSAADTITVVTEDGSNSAKYPEKSEFFERLITEGPFVYGDHGVDLGKINFDWVDAELIKEGQRFYRENFAACGMLSGFSTLISLSFTRIITRSVQTRSYLDRDKSLRRWFANAYRTKLWIEADLFEKISKGTQDIYELRKSHAAAAKKYDRNDPLPEIEPLSEKNKKLLDALHEDLKCIDDTGVPLDLLIDYHPEQQFTQFDMAIAIMIFYMFLIFPTQFGAKDDDRGIQGYVHVWAVIGKLMGAEDRFNPALHFNDQIAQRKMLTGILLASFKHMDTYAMAQWNTSIVTFRRILAPLTVASVLYFCVKVLAFNGLQEAPHIYELMSFLDKTSYKILTMFFCLMRKFWFVRIFANAVYRLAIFTFAKFIN